MEALLRDRQLLYVTGKGGVGKTTVAAALGLAAAARGPADDRLRGRRAGSRLARVPARGRGRRRPRCSSPTNLWAITIDPQRALEEWLGKQIGGAALQVLARSSAFQYFVAAAPGAKELITIAKVWELAQRAPLGRSATARTTSWSSTRPASGHGLAMLTTPRTFGEIARVGPIRRQAYKVRDLLADPERTGYVAVALPEEMPVNETLELERRLPEAVGLGLEAIVVNGVWPERFSAADAERDAGGRPTAAAARCGPRSPRTSARAASAATCGGCAARDGEGRHAPVPVRVRGRAARSTSSSPPTSRRKL